jgi:hypothetical protein
VTDTTEFTDAQLSQLNQEIESGKRASKAYDIFLRQFIDDKREQLYQAFRDNSLEDINKLADIKRLDLALASIENEVFSVIETGRLASISLNNDNLGE